MGSNTTRTLLLVLPAVFSILALGSLMLGEAEPPSPQRSARLLQQDMARFDAGLASGPRPATAWLAPPVHRAPEQAAPLAETMPRTDAPSPRILQLAVSLDAAEFFDEQFERAFERAQPGFDLQLRTLPGRDAVDLMLGGHGDAAVILGELSPREVRAGLRQTQLGCEVFALAVPRSCALQSLASWQLRSLLAGEISNWSQLGCEPGELTLALPHAHGAADRAARAILDGAPLRPDGMHLENDQQVFDQLLRTKGVIGLVRAASIAMAPDARLVQIDSVVPTRENVLYGFYPFGTQVNLVTSGMPSPIASLVWQFTQSDAGRELLGRRLSLGL